MSDECELENKTKMGPGIGTGMGFTVQTGLGSAQRGHTMAWILRRGLGQGHFGYTVDLWDRSALVRAMTTEAGHWRESRLSRSVNGQKPWWWSQLKFREKANFCPGTSRCKSRAFAKCYQKSTLCLVCDVITRWVGFRPGHCCAFSPLVALVLLALLVASAPSTHQWNRKSERIEAGRKHVIYRPTRMTPAATSF